MEGVKNNGSGETLINAFDKPTKMSIFTQKLTFFLIIAIILGSGSGYVLSKIVESKVIKKEGGLKDSSSVSKRTIVGSDDTKTFNDTATGELRVGGIDGEGAYHLVRPGGESQNVYLTSSVIDLSQFVGKKIKVWGQTQKAKAAGWLMDAGRVEVLE